MPPFSLTGKTALITGSSSGLGFEIAKLFASSGATVWINGRRQSAVNKAVADIQNMGGDAAPLCVDVTDDAAIEQAFIKIADLGLDILVNNVGLRDRRQLPAFSKADVSRLIEADLIAPFMLAQKAANLMIAAGNGGRIINISSIAGLIAQPGDAVYTTAKAGINGLTRALAAELGPHGITANAIAPGFFKTAPNIEASKDPTIAARLKAATSLGRWGDPKELAPAALFLASSEASYITGQILAVDGGYTAHY
ncbi:MAG: SDR family oxidoreductase [Pseudoruegeria sp.]